MIGLLGRERGVAVLALGLVGRKSLPAAFVEVPVGTEPVAGAFELDFFS